MKVLAIDCKSNGFSGEIYLIAAVVIDQEKNTIDEFYGQIPIYFITDKDSINFLKWLNIKPNYRMHMEMIKAFGEFYKKHKESEIVFRNNFLPLAKLFIECVDYNFLSIKDIPYSVSSNNEYKALNPITEITSLLHITGKEISSERKNLITLYSPLNECRKMCDVYIDIFNKFPETTEHQ